MKYTVHCTNNARAANRGAGEDEINDIEFEGSLNEVLNFGAWAMNGALGWPDEDEFRDEVDSGEWEMRSDKNAKDDMNSADLGAGSPVVFWIKDANGRKVYDGNLDESDWEPEEEEEDEEDWEVVDKEEEEEPWTGGDFEIKDGVLVEYHGKGGDVVIPDGVTSIGYMAFRGCEDLTSVKISEGVTDIGSDAFWGCEDLTSVTISDSVKSIGWDAFYGCDNLESVTIPSSVTIIGFSAFGDCTKLADVKILNPKLFNEVVKNPGRSFRHTPWAEKVKSGTLNESRKITLTFGQLKRLIKEGV